MIQPRFSGNVVMHLDEQTGARLRQADAMEPIRLLLEERSPHRVHGDAIHFLVHCHQQLRHLNAGCQGLQCEGAVLPTAPAHPSLRCHGQMEAHMEWLREGPHSDLRQDLDPSVRSVDTDPLPVADQSGGPLHTHDGR